MSFFGDWAEESLLQAERALKLLGVPKPEWLNTAYYNEKVLAFASRNADEMSMASITV